MTQSTQDFKTTQRRQADVENGQIEALAEQGMQGAAAVLDPVNGVAFPAECLLNAFAQCNVVFDKQQTHGVSVS